MELKRRGNVAILTFLLSLFNLSVLYGVDVKFFERDIFSNKSQQIQKFVSFCVTDDHLLLIPDVDAGDIKILDHNDQSLRWLSNIGSKGFSSSDFQKPTYCSYDPIERRLAVLDSKLKKIFIYERPNPRNRLDFKRVGEIPCFLGAHELQLKKNKLYISGAIIAPDNVLYHFYSIELEQSEEKNKIVAGKIDYLLPSWIKYGFQSSQNVEKQILDKGIQTLGYYGWFFIDDYDNAFFIWESQLRIIRLNLRSSANKISDYWGNKTPNYFPPKLTDVLIQSFNHNDLIYKSERNSMSYILDIFSTPTSIAIIYQGPDIKAFIQTYSRTGNFVKETPISLPHDSRFYYDATTQKLFILSNQENSDQILYTSIGIR